MDATEIIQAIDAEIARLEQVKTLLNGNDTAPVKRGRPLGSINKSTPKPRKKMSPQGRANIAAAQKARWVKAKG
jgi:hypothetical protein